MPDRAAHETAVLVLTPSGRDASLASRALEQAGFASIVCGDGEALVERIAAGAGAALLAEEALTPTLVTRLVAVLAEQLPWSDFPFLIFTERAATSRAPRSAHGSCTLAVATYWSRCRIDWAWRVRICATAARASSLIVGFGRVAAVADQPPSIVVLAIAYRPARVTTAVLRFIMLLR